MGEKKKKESSDSFELEHVFFSTKSPYALISQHTSLQLEKCLFFSGHIQTKVNSFASEFRKLFFPNDIYAGVTCAFTVAVTMIILGNGHCVHIKPFAVVIIVGIIIKKSLDRGKGRAPLAFS